MNIWDSRARLDWMLVESERDSCVTESVESDDVLRSI